MNEQRFISGYSAFSLKLPSPMAEGTSLIAEFELGADTSELAPYINAVAQKALYYEKPPHIRFLLDGVLCTLFGSGGSAASFHDRGQALDFMEMLISFLNRIYQNKDSIRPNYKVYKPISILDLLRLLPRTNCRECGFSTCMAFAAALSRQKTDSFMCPEFSRPISFKAVYPVLDDKGNLLSTVSLDIDGSPRDFNCRREYAAAEDFGNKIDKDPEPIGGIFSKTRNDSLPTPLTRRELDVLRLMAEGATNMEISKSLHVSPHTVKSHVIHIFNKLGVDDRTQASVWATRHGLL
ncbi:LuxR C-terminal-related transcriptional regulator [Desulforhabdus amnigena]|uniref:LuxR C-terminal-related transcriptional regulator n=1 Tax=Desulforhabdus amnigena TaxID=40218 RepID=UPI002491E6E4|nr:LuxR C-terminal-related transcriptional regulator [Desulforhabdus amnigena]